MATRSDMSVSLAGQPLASPLVVAAGTGGYISALKGMLDLRCIGAITTKSITAESREGNPPWRVIDIPGGMLNAVGLANVGVERFIAEHVREAAEVEPVVIGSIAGHSIDDYVTVAGAFDAQAHLPMVELNVSCPNTSDGLQFGEHPESLRELLREVRPVLTQTKMIVKLSPNVGDIVGMARCAIEEGADVLTLINTVAAMSIDVETRQPRLSRGSGGLSGPPIHCIAVHMVNQVYDAVAREAKVPIIGLGGVMDWRDAAELILAGASAVGIGTGLFVDTHLPQRVLRGLRTWVQRQGCQSVTELTGQVQP